MLTSDNYFSREMQMEYMGVSQFKAFEKCEAAALAELKGEYQREKTTSLLVGSYVDAYFEGSLERFKENNPEIFTKKGELKAEYRKTDTIIQRIERDPLFMTFLSGEKQVIMTGTIEGVPVKIKIDSYIRGKLIDDLKVMKDFAPVYVPEQGRLNWVEAWGYDLQGAVYQEIVRQNTGEKLPFYLSAVTKEPEPDIDIIELSQAYLDVSLVHFRGNVIRYDGIKKGLFQPKRCEKCDYCKRTKVLTAPRKMEVLDYVE